jgi:uncharacterized membrane protein (DUF4010 family)
MRIVSFFKKYEGLRFALIAAFVIAAWQLSPDGYVGPYGAWNPHAILEFLVTIFSISLVGNLIIQWFGLNNGVLLAGLIGGFASSTATIHSLGIIARANPQMVHRVATGAVLSNIATLVQLVVLTRLLAPQVLPALIQPMIFGAIAMVIFTAWSLIFIGQPSRVIAKTEQSEVRQLFDWKGLLTLTGILCAVSFVSAWLNAVYGQRGLWVGAAVSGFVDAHAIVPAVASLLAQKKLQVSDALLPLLLALSTNTLTRSLIAMQAGGWSYAKRVLGGIVTTTLCVWLGYFLSPLQHIF